MKNFSSVVLTAAILVGTSAFAAGIATLESVKGTPSMDIGDAVWSKAKPISVVLDQMPYEPNPPYKGMKKSTAMIQSMYDDKNIY